MPTVDCREGRLDVLYRPGEGKTLVATWPTSLAGRTFTVVFGAGTLPAVVADATLTITASGAALAEATNATAWRVVETTGGGSELVWAGQWVPSSRGSAADPGEVTVRVVDVDVTVQVNGGPGPAGAAGPAGADGQGVPVGGTAGQVLAKVTATDFDTAWVAPSGGGGGGQVDSVVAGAGVSVDSTDPVNPVVTAEVTQLELDAVAAAAQPLDSDLTAIAALATTAYGRAFLALADAAAGRTALGLGTAATAATGDFDPAGAASAAQAASQPLDSDLTALAALTTTVYGRSLLEAADAAALRTLAGLVIGTDVQAYSAVLAATTASFTTADETKLDGIEAGATADQSAAEILAALLTVDGVGSGLDADLLDGQSSSAFATADEPVAAAHIADTADAHAASAVSVDSTTLVGTGTDVQAVFEELDNWIADHLADATAAHAASAVAFTPTGTIAATDVQAAIAEVAAEAGGGSVDDTAYDATSWNGVTTTAPSKNAVRDKVETLAPVASPTFTGTPAAPTAAQGTNTTQIATTAYVQTEAGLLVPKSVLTTDGDLLTRASGVPARITRASLAADAAFTEAFAPIQPSIFIAAGSFSAVTGSPVLGEAGSDVPGFLLDGAGATERVATIVAVPAGWSTFDAQLVWTNAGAGSGNVHWDVAYSPGFGDGEAATHSTFATDQDVAAPAQNTAKYTTMASGAAVPSTGELLPIRVGRNSANAGDTLTNDVAVLGMRLIRAS